MTKAQILKLNSMRIAGAKAPQIALELGVSYNTVASYLRRHPLTESIPLCKHCGSPLIMIPGKRKKQFCGKECKSAWWNIHRYEGRKNVITRKCKYCGKEFICYESTDRKYCSTVCYHNSRKTGNL